MKDHSVGFLLEIFTCFEIFICFDVLAIDLSIGT